MAIPEPIPAKSLLRQSMRQALREHPRDSQPACAALHQWLLDRPALRTIAIYSPLPGEVDLSGVLPDHPRLTWLFPKIVGHHLSFHPGHDLVPGTLGILEPAAGTPEVALREIDAFICPGLAFDDHHHRLGRGRGFYDRLLAQARPDSLKVGICFPFQRVPDTFPEPHDVPMDEVLF